MPPMCAQEPNATRVAALEPEGLPFGGGAIGWFGYDLGRRFERLPATALDRQGLPDMALGLYDWALLVDHARQRTWLAGRGGRSPQARERLQRSALAPGPAGLPGAFRLTDTSMVCPGGTDAPICCAAGALWLWRMRSSA